MSYTIPAVIEKSGSGERAYGIYSKLLMNRIIVLGTAINDEIANGIIAQLLYLDSRSSDEIKLYVNSPGGSVTAGLAILDTMNHVKAPVSTMCIGQAASMAAVLLSAGEKGLRFSLPNSRILIHQPLGGTQGQASDIQIAASEILRLKEKLNNILATNTCQPIKKIEQDTDRDYILEPEEAITYGIIDSIKTKKS